MSSATRGQPHAGAGCCSRLSLQGKWEFFCQNEEIRAALTSLVPLISVWCLCAHRLSVLSEVCVCAGGQQKLFKC